MNLKSITDSEKPEGFFVQTARDYDMTVEEVKNIYRKYPDTLYEELESFIEARANSDY